MSAFDRKDELTPAEKEAWLQSIAEHRAKIQREQDINHDWYITHAAMNCLKQLSADRVESRKVLARAAQLYELLAPTMPDADKPS